MSRRHSYSLPDGKSKLVPLLIATLVVVFLIVVFWQNFKWSREPTDSRPVATESGSFNLPTKGSKASESLPDEDEPSLPEITPEGHGSGRTASSPVSNGSQKHPDRDVHQNGDGADEHRSRRADDQRPLQQKSVSEGSKPRSGDEEPTDSDKKPFLIENQTIRDLNGKIVFKGSIDLKPTLDRIERGGTNRHRNDGTTFQNREGRLPRKSAGYYKEYVHPTHGESGPGPQRIILGRDGEVWYTPDHYKTFKQITPVSQPTSDSK